ncbi:MAG: hypothetical protein EA376_00340 [Phycisphaeraceae bacterium]|nr:MAG: hypothetical protein EA376_00340 [Phycisphaeraceae bacterium]
MTSIPSATWRVLAQYPKAERPPTGLDAAWRGFTGHIARLAPRRALYMRRAGAVLALEKQFATLSDARLHEQALDLRALFRRGRETRADILRAYALVRETAFRELGEKPYRVQVAGALAIEAGCIAEMATGEGKTLTATMPAVIAGWRGRGCHIITVNDYLARRDAEWMCELYRRCAVTVAHVQAGMSPPERRAAYAADITYCTNKEVAADFLRDQIVINRIGGLISTRLSAVAPGAGGAEGIADHLMLRGLAHAIVDEADSVLIDEAVTPLIISSTGADEERVDAYQQAAEIAAGLDEGEHYRVDHRHREITLTEAGAERARLMSEPLGGLWTGRRRREELVNQAISARVFYQRGRQYVVHEGKVVIVDDFTGRLMPDRSWRDGLHQAVEAKELLEITPFKDTQARISFQRFFRMYRRLSGMTGTAAEARQELWKTYRVPVVVIPTNRSVQRRQRPDRVFTTEDRKWGAIVEEVGALHERGVPVLIGARTVRASEILSELLEADGIRHQVLNAVRHAEEAQIIAGAGVRGAVTVATNMAGRGTDIRLGKGVAELGGLHVIATERHDDGRVDRQLFGRAGRQGDPGEARAFVSLEDELPVRFAPRFTRLVCGVSGSRAEASGLMARSLFMIAQRRAQWYAARSRRAVRRADDWLEDALGFAGSEAS